MTMPNYLVLGAAKCGTDALCNYLGQHPQVFMSANKEPNFFVAEGQAAIPYGGPGDHDTLQRLDMWVNTLDRYQALFAAVTTEQAIGEGTTWYLYDEGAPARIRRHIPGARLIAILRNPVDRAYSAYTMLLRDGRETARDFSRALALEDQRVHANWEPLWHYRRMGFYHAQLRRYYDTFDASQLHVLIYDEFNARPRDVMRGVFQFLGVDDQFEPDTSERHNVSLVPKHPTYHRFIVGGSPVKTLAKSLLPEPVRQRVKESLVPSNLTKPAPIMPDVRSELVSVFRPDILKLQDLLNRDLSHWLA